MQVTKIDERDQIKHIAWRALKKINNKSSTKIWYLEKNRVQKHSLKLVPIVQHKGFKIKNVIKAWGCTVTARDRDCCNSWRNLSKCANLTLPFNSSDFGQLFKSTFSPLYHRSESGIKIRLKCYKCFHSNFKSKNVPLKNLKFNKFLTGNLTNRLTSMHQNTREECINANNRIKESHK